MQRLDWSILGLYVVGLAFLTLYTRRFVRSVADFLAASRLAGRYLLTVSTGFGGAIAIIAIWEMLYVAGLPSQWWAMMGVPVGLLLSLTGFVIYRFRQTRALTLAQFFEMRYSRGFRFFAGVLLCVSGILNYGIFPAVSSRFMIYFLGLPEYLHLGGITVSSFPVVMALYLLLALAPVLVGGQISILIIDFFQGLLTLLIYIALLLYLLHTFAWTDIMAGLQIAPAGRSMINPFDTADSHEFSVGYFLIAVFGQIYNARSWQGTSGFNASARTPHEAKMAGILGSWRFFILQLCALLFPLVAYAALHLPKFAHLASPILHDIQAIVDPTLRQQMVVPLFLNHILPVGLMGLFATLVVASTVSCDNIYLHSWGTILIQDVFLPLWKKSLTPAGHLRLFRWAIVGVAAFAFTFSLLFPLKQFVLMYFALTGAIYLGGAGAVIIGGLYWKHGTTMAAWVAMSTGSALAFGGLLIQQSWSETINPMLRDWFPEVVWLATTAHHFPVSGQMLYFLAMLLASLLYIAVSLLGPRKVHNLDELLHRGSYALAEDQVGAAARGPRSWKTLLGLDPDFNRGEKIIFWATFWWSMSWWGVFILGTIVYGFHPFGNDAWSWFWFFKIWLSVLLAGGLGLWFAWGGFGDLRDLLRDLKKPRAHSDDDGRLDGP
jgi:SSS family solute:Na+ symporter